MTDHLIIHNDCGLPIELCICPTATIESVQCECGGIVGKTHIPFRDCEVCEGEGHYLLITGDTNPIEIKDD